MRGAGVPRVCRTRGRGSVVATLIAVLSLGLTLVPTTAAAAHQGSRVRVEVLATGQPGALPAGWYLGEYFAQVYGTPVGSEPDCYRLGRRQVLKVPSPSSGPPPVCELRLGAPLLLEGWASAISNLEAPFSSDRAVQLRAAREGDLATAKDVHVSIDGGRSVDLRARGFEVVTPQRTVQLPENNVFGPGVEPQTITLTAHGWMATVRGFSTGVHHLVLTYVLDFGAGPFDLVFDQVVVVGDR